MEVRAGSCGEEPLWWGPGDWAARGREGGRGRMIRGGFWVGGVAAGRDWADISLWALQRSGVLCWSHPLRKREGERDPECAHPVGRLRPPGRNRWPANGVGCQGQEGRLVSSLGFFFHLHCLPSSLLTPPHLLAFCCQSQARGDSELGLGAPSQRRGCGGGGWGAYMRTGNVRDIGLALWPDRLVAELCMCMCVSDARVCVRDARV